MRLAELGLITQPDTVLTWIGLALSFLEGLDKDHLQRRPDNLGIV